jgi:hypothetical protein
MYSAAASEKRLAGSELTELMPTGVWIRYGEYYLGRVSDEVLEADRESGPIRFVRQDEEKPTLGRKTQI